MRPCSIYFLNHISNKCGVVKLTLTLAVAGRGHLNYTSPTYSLQTAFGLNAVLSCAYELVLLSSTVICLQQACYKKKHVTKGNQWKEG
jgi:hypothetical protein